MLDGVTLDQLRMLVSVAREGSFSAAARRVRRVQSAVSHGIATLESQLGLQLFDRSTRAPTLTDAGRAVVASAERVLAEADALRALASGIAGGLEPHVALSVDALFPMGLIVTACREFAREFPTVELRVFTETLGAATARVVDGTCDLGIVNDIALVKGLDRRHVTTIELVPVVAAEHPLARTPSASSRALEGHVQIVLSERGLEGRGPEHSVLSTRTFRVADLGTKHAFLLGALGWGNMPLHMIEGDLAAGRLVRLRSPALPRDALALPMSVVTRQGTTAGPATRWLASRLESLCAGAPRPVSPDRTRAPRRPSAPRSGRSRAR
jgi:DNA-binding transcriptional LysR family regulator